MGIKLHYAIGSIVDLMGEKCKVVNVHHKDECTEYDLESLELTDIDGSPVFYGYVKEDVLS